MCVCVREREREGEREREEHQRRRAIHNLEVKRDPPHVIHPVRAHSAGAAPEEGHTCTERNSSQFKNNNFTEMRSGPEEGSY